MRVGGADLQIAGEKLKRDWLLRWIEDPKNYFSDTLMPRFRLPRADQEALVEYILREDVFLSSDEEEEAVPAERWKTLEDTERVKRGKRLVEISRCVVCHEVEGIPEVITIPPKKPLPPKNTFEFLAYDVKCLSCHAIGGVGGTYAPDLSTEGSRLREQWVADFVHEPDLVRPLSQQMPKLNLTKEEASLSAEYMAKNTRSKKIPAKIPEEP